MTYYRTCVVKKKTVHTKRVAEEIGENEKLVRKSEATKSWFVVLVLPEKYVWSGKKMCLWK